MKTTAAAPGKIILFGEHAVVYSRPAIAVPVVDVQATATILDLSPGSGCTLIAHDLGSQLRLSTTGEDDALGLIVRLTLDELALAADPDWQIEIRSQIPIASGLGSGAAVSTALVRAIFHHVGLDPEPETISRLVYRSEELHHGTPSGIDNTVIAYAQPIWFVRGEPIRTFVPARSFTIAIADSGIGSPTKETVGDVRRAWQRDPARYEDWFDEIGEIVHAARSVMESGEVAALGPLMDRNQTLLRQIGVSADPLERLITAARNAGAAGAKLSGGGRGGNVIALVETETAPAIRRAFLDAGAKQVLVTTVIGDRGLETGD
ncbi:MAG: mevalonate kinase [Caldilineaceae bacterium]|nr:mevalonate kinase [Caldilineaceae bacterium]